MVHAVSASYLRSEHISPPALALAVLLHAMLALALWGLSHYQPFMPPAQDPIEVTIEKPQPPAKPPETKLELPPPPPPLPPVIEGLQPPAPIVSDKPTQVPTPNTRARELAPPQTAEKVETKPAPPPTGVEPPPPAATPQGRGMAVPANPLPRPSPLNRSQQQRQAATTAGPEQPKPSPFVNPADEYNRARAQDNYLWQVVTKLRGYQYRANVSRAQGVTVVRIVIARDGRLLDAEVVSSSGEPEMDRGVLAGVRAGSPYTPLPDNIAGASATFRLPLVSVKEGR